MPSGKKLPPYLQVFALEKPLQRVWEGVFPCMNRGKLLRVAWEDVGSRVAEVEWALVQPVFVGADLPLVGGTADAKEVGKVAAVAKSSDAGGCPC